MKLWFRFLMLFCLALPLSAAGAQETVKIGIIYGESATTATGISLELLGTRLAIEELNRNGGLLGRQIELIELNNAQTPLGSRQAAEKAVTVGTVAVIGPSTSSHALLAGAVLQNAGIPMILTFATNPDVTLLGDYIFRVCFSDTFQGKALGAFAANDLKAKTAVILTCSEEKYSIDLSDIFSTAFMATGGTILWQGEYLSTATDFQDLLEETARKNPDIVFLPGYDSASGFLIRQSRNLGIDLPFLGSDAWSDRLYAFGRESIEGNYYSAHWCPDTDNEASRQFVRQYQDRFESSEITSFGLCRDAVYLLADAAVRANSLVPASIRDALAETTAFQGVSGTITIDENGDAIKPVCFFKFEKGESVFIKTVAP